MRHGYGLGYAIVFAAFGCVPIGAYGKAVAQQQSRRQWLAVKVNGLVLGGDGALQARGVGHGQHFAGDLLGQLPIVDTLYEIGGKAFGMGHRGCQQRCR